MKAENLTYEMLTDEKDREIYNFTLPDIYYKYKLKGVVVHYGTTEGGHYYSFIKHRECNKWYEFNDTVVRDYDLANLPEDTFGGFVRLETPKAPSGARQNVQSEKLHSAYVLIYEREIFLDNDKLFDLRETETAKDLTPFVNSYRFEPWPIAIDQNIADEITLKFDKNFIAAKIYDEYFLDIVTDILCLDANLKDQPGQAAHRQMDIDDDCEDMTQLKFAATFLLTVVLRSDSRLRYCERLVPLIMSAITKPEFARWFASCFTHRHTINEFFANWWSTQACRVIWGLLEKAVTQVYTQEKDAVSEVVKELYDLSADKPGGPVLLLMKVMNDTKANIPTSLRVLYQFIAVVMAKLQSSEMSLLGQFMYYSVFDLFASLCVEFRMILWSFRIYALLFSSSFGNQISADALLPELYSQIKTEFDTEFTLVDAHGSDAHDTEFDDDDIGRSIFYRLSKFDRVVISNLAKDVEPFVYSFKVISKLIRSWQILSEARSKYEDSPYRMDNLRPIQSISIRELDGLVDPADSTVGVLFGSRCTSKPLRNELAKLYGHALFNDDRAAALCKLLVTSINQEEFKDVANYERVLFTVLTLKDALMAERVSGVLDLCKRLMDYNANEYAFLDTFVGMVVKFAKRDRTFMRMLYKHDMVDRLMKWLRSNPSPPVESLRSPASVFRNQKCNNKLSYQTIASEATVITDYIQK